MEHMYSKKAIRRANFCIKKSFVKIVFLPCTRSSSKSFPWFHKLEAKFESSDTLIPANSKGKSKMDSPLCDNKKIDIAKRGNGDIIEAGVLHSFNISHAFLQLILILTLNLCQGVLSWISLLRPSLLLFSAYLFFRSSFISRPFVLPMKSNLSYALDQ